MATARTAAPLGEARVQLPSRLMEVFQKHPRILIKHHPAGLWPVDPGMLGEIEWARLVKTRDFAKNFEVVVMMK